MSAKVVVVLRNIDGTCRYDPIDMDGVTTVAQLKQRVSKHFGVPSFCQTVEYRGKRLVDERSVASYDLDPCIVLDVYPRPPSRL